MKTCTYCGKLYPDEAPNCSLDGYPLQPEAPQPALAPPQPVKHSLLGIASFGISITVACLLFTLFAVAGILNANHVQNGEPYPGQTIVGMIAVLLLMADTVAAGLGIAALCQSGRKHLFAILGLVFSGLTLLGSVGLILLGLAITARVAH